MVDVSAVDVVTGILAYDSVKRVLGPTADYLGGELKSFAQKQLTNVRGIFSKAETKIDPSDGDDPTIGASPRVLRAVLNEGSFVDDEIGQHYFAGVLAASRTKNAESDAAVMFASMLSRLSTYHMRMHCVLYSGFRKKYLDADVNLLTEQGYHAAKLFFSHNKLHTLLQSTPIDVAGGRYETALHVLSKEDLIGPLSYGQLYLEPTSNRVGLMLSFSPTVLGVQLLLAALG